MNISDSHYQYLQNPIYAPVNVPNYSNSPAFEIINNGCINREENEEKTKRKSLQKLYNVRSRGNIFFFISIFPFFGFYSSFKPKLTKKIYFFKDANFI